MAAIWKREFDVKGIFWNVWGVLLIVDGGWHMTMKDPSLTALSYQMLPLVTNQLMGDNKEFDIKGIFWDVLLIVGGGEYMIMKRSITDCPWLPIVGPSNQSINGW